MQVYSVYVWDTKIPEYETGGKQMPKSLPRVDAFPANEIYGPYYQSSATSVYPFSLTPALK